jgi:hypothetical protein
VSPFTSQGGRIAPNAALSLGRKIPFLAERQRRVR